MLRHLRNSINDHESRLEEVIWGRWFWQQSKALMGLPIGPQ